MDVVTIHPTTYLPEEMVEGYTSMVWTERHFEPGEFQLKTSMIDETAAKIPEGSFISLRDSAEIMQVETQSTQINDEGVAELTVKGRSFVSCFEQRYVAGDYGFGWDMLQDYTAQDALLVLMYNAINNPTTQDLTGSPSAHDPSDVLPNTVITKTIHDSYITSTDVNADVDPADLSTPQTWAMQSGQVGEKVLNFLTLAELGLRIIRPPTLGLYGVYVQSDGSFAPIKLNDHYLRFDVYNGRNRTTRPSDSDPLEPVIFRYDAGHVVSPNFLSSSKDYKNFAHVSSSYGDVDVYSDGTMELVGTTGGIPGHDIYQMFPLTGNQRRSMFVDAGTLDDSMLSDPELALRQIGNTALKRARRLKLMDAAVSLQTPYRYGVEYGLGDYVTMIGGPDFVQNMQVVEYIRTEDENGDLAYPSLIQKEPPQFLPTETD